MKLFLFFRWSIFYFFESPPHLHVHSSPWQQDFISFFKQGCHSKKAHDFSPSGALKLFTLRTMLENTMTVYFFMKTKFACLVVIKVVTF